MYIEDLLDAPLEKEKDKEKGKDKGKGKGKGRKTVVKHRNDTAAVLQQFLDLGIVKVCREAVPAEWAFCDTEEKPVSKPENSFFAPPFPQLRNDKYPLSARDMPGPKAMRGVRTKWNEMGSGLEI